VANWDGAEYRINGLQQAMAATALEGLDLRGDEKVLDVGCGDGAVSSRIADRLPTGSVLGVDPSPRMIDFAQRHARPGRLEFRSGDVLTLDYDGSFDVVVSFNVLHWVADHPEALRRITRSVRPGGRVILLLVCDGPRRSLEDIATDTTRDDRWAPSFQDFVPPFRHPAPDGFGAACTAAGLEPAELADTDRTWDFGDRETFRRWCAAGFRSWTDRLDPSQAESFVDEVVDRYQAEIGATGVFRFYQLRVDALRRRTPAR
jgi:trans-aconitate 2-methyltransferase